MAGTEIRNALWDSKSLTLGVNRTQSAIMENYLSGRSLDPTVPAQRWTTSATTATRGVKMATSASRRIGTQSCLADR